MATRLTSLGVMAVCVWLSAGACGRAQESSPLADALQTSAGDVSSGALGRGAGGEAIENPLPRVWFRADYLLWWLRGSDVPVLAGTIPVQEAELVRQFPAVAIGPLAGGSGLDYPAQSGLRLGAGLWLGETGVYGLSAGFLQLEQGQKAFRFVSRGAQPLGSVFHDPAAGQNIFVMLAIPGLRAGELSVSAQQRFRSAEVQVSRRLEWSGPIAWLQLLAGLRYLEFTEQLRVAGASRVIPGGRLPCG